jgi:hypothetical protein
MSDRRAEFDTLLALRPTSTALLVVDMQRGFVDPGQAMEVPPARESVLASARWSTSFARRDAPSSSRSSSTRTPHRC